MSDTQDIKAEGWKSGSGARSLCLRVLWAVPLFLALACASTSSGTRTVPNNNTSAEDDDNTPAQTNDNAPLPSGPSTAAVLGPAGGRLDLRAPGDPGDGAAALVPADMLTAEQTVTLTAGEPPADVGDDVRPLLLGPVFQLQAEFEGDHGRFGLLVPYVAPAAKGASALQSTDGAAGTGDVAVALLEGGTCIVLDDPYDLYDEARSLLGDAVGEADAPLLAHDAIPAGFVYAEVSGPGAYVAVSRSQVPAEDPLIEYHHAGAAYPTLVIVHGWNNEASNNPNTWQGRMAQAAIELISLENLAQAQNADADVLVDDVNILFWNWGARAHTGWTWWNSYVATNEEGEALAMALLDAMNQGAIADDPASFHLIGHSHGGYVSGVCGKVLQDRFGQPTWVGQLTGLDVPAEDVISWVAHIADNAWGWLLSIFSFDSFSPSTYDIGIYPSAFQLVTWYPVPGGLVPSLVLADDGTSLIISQAVTGWDHGGDHGIHEWYTQQKIVNRGWDSLVMLKPPAPATDVVLPREAAGTQARLNYTLDCVGSWSEGNPAPRAETGENLLFPYEPAPAPPFGAPTGWTDLEREAVSGSTSVHLFAHVDLWNAVLPGAWFTLGCELDPYAGSVIAASATMDYAQQWRVPARSVIGGAPAPLLVAFNGTVDQTLTWPGGTLVLRATGPAAAQDVRTTCIGAAAGGAVNVSWAASAEACPDASSNGTAQAGASASVLAFYAQIEDDLGMRVLSDFGLMRGAGRAFRLSSPSLGTMDRGGRTWSDVWGPPVIPHVPEDAIADPHVEVTPGKPGIYVIRTTIQSADDETTTGFNAPIVVTGSTR
jgi:hypothetical protein